MIGVIFTQKQNNPFTFNELKVSKKNHLNIFLDYA